MKFGIRNLHIVLILCELRENRPRESCAYVVAGNGNYIYTCAVKLCGILKVKNALVQLVCSVTKCTACDRVASVCSSQKAVCCICLHLACSRQPADRAGRPVIKPNRSKPDKTGLNLQFAVCCTTLGCKHWVLKSNTALALGV